MSQLKTLRPILILFSVLLLHQSTAQLLYSPSSDCNSCDGSASFSTLIPGNHLYTWTDQDFNPVFSEINATQNSGVNGLCPGVYTLEVSTGELFYFEIGTIASPGVQPEVIEICSSQGNTDLSDYFSSALPAGGTWYSPSGIVISPIINGNNASDGFYEYSYDDSGCLMMTGVQLSVVQNANPGLSTTYLICENYSEFYMLDFMAGSPDPGGEWFDGVAQPMDGWYDPQSMNPGTFTYMLNNVPGCGPVFSTISIQENQLPDPGLDTSIEVCPGAPPFNLSTQLSGTPQPGGQWLDENDTPVNINFNPLVMPSGVYHYHVNGLTPCPGQDAYLTINYTPALPAGEDNNITVCELSGSFDLINMLGGNPAVGGIWTDINGNVVPGQFDPIQAGTFVFNYSFDGIGCSLFDTQLIVDVETMPDAGLPSTITICENELIFDLFQILDANTNPGGTWIDSNSLNQISSIVDLSPGIHQYTYEVDGMVCSSVASNYELIVEGTALEVSDTFTPLCATENPVDLQQMQETQGISGNWFENGTSVIPIVDPGTSDSGIYLFVSGNNSACPPDSSFHEVMIEEPLFLSQSLSIDLCETTGQFNLDSVLEGIDFTLGSWEENNTIISQQIELLPGEFNYVFVSDAQNICASSELHVAIDVIEQLSAGTNSSVEFCPDQPAVAMADLLPENASPGGFWTLDNVLFTDSYFDPMLHPSGSLVYEVTGILPCVSEQSEMTINIFPAPTFEAGPDITACSAAQEIQIGSSPEEGCTYEWYPTSNLNDPNISNPSISFIENISSPEITEYHVTVGIGNCTFNDSLLVTTLPLPELTEINDIDICESGAVQLEVSTNADVLWGPSNLFPYPEEQIQSIIPDSSTQIWFTITNEWGCYKSDSSFITVNPLPDISFEFIVNNNCPPASIEVNNLSQNNFGVDYTWFVDGSEIALENNTLTVSNSGSHILSLQGTTESGCTSELIADGVVEVFETPISSFVITPEELSNTENFALFENESLNSSQYEWTIDEIPFSYEINTSHYFESDVEKNFEICLITWSENGCTDTTCRTIHYVSDLLLYVPNAFTPDNDGINDVFIPYSMGHDVTFYHFMVFDRWGELIFSTTDTQQGWIGNIHNGSYYCSPGVYSWKIDLKKSDSAELKNFNGHVNLIR